MNPVFFFFKAWNYINIKRFNFVAQVSSIVLIIIMFTELAQIEFHIN